MKSTIKALLIVVAVVLGVLASHTLASETSQKDPEYQEDCVVDEQSDCAEMCVIENNCCIKSCNWVEANAKAKCLKHCKSILKKCHKKCDEKPAED